MMITCGSRATTGSQATRVQEVSTSSMMLRPPAAAIIALGMA